MTDTAESAAVKALLNYGQADEDGVMCVVSRQAVHEVADEIATLRSLNAELVRALSELRDWMSVYSGPLTDRLKAKADDVLSRARAKEDT